MDLNKPLPVSITMDFEDEQFDSITVKCVYEGLHTICFSCGQYGHKLDNCYHSTQPVNSTNEMNDNQLSKKHPEEEKLRIESTTHGPWLLASKHRSRRKPNTIQNGPPNTLGHQNRITTGITSPPETEARRKNVAHHVTKNWAPPQHAASVNGAMADSASSPANQATASPHANASRDPLCSSSNHDLQTIVSSMNPGTQQHHDQACTHVLESYPPTANYSMVSHAPNHQVPPCSPPINHASTTPTNISDPQNHNKFAILTEINDVGQQSLPDFNDVDMPESAEMVSTIALIPLDVDVGREKISIGFRGSSSNGERNKTKPKNNNLGPTKQKLKKIPQ